MSKKSARVETLIAEHRGQGLNAHYLGYFACFNASRFYDAHDALEELWLKDRQSPTGAFYKGLIQLAGAFVHLQKNHLKPAAALFRLARANLEEYEDSFEGLDVAATLRMIQEWLGKLESGGFAVNPLTTGRGPTFAIREQAAAGNASFISP